MKTKHLIDITNKKQHQQQQLTTFSARDGQTDRRTATRYALMLFRLCCCCWTFVCRIGAIGEAHFSWAYFLMLKYFSYVPHITSKWVRDAWLAKCARIPPTHELQQISFRGEGTSHGKFQINWFNSNDDSNKSLAVSLVFDASCAPHTYQIFGLVI